MNQSKEAQPTQFKIVHLLYITAVLASSMAFFGDWGAWAIAPGLLGLLFWVPVYLSQKRLTVFFLSLFAYFVFSCFITVAIVPANLHRPELARQRICRFNKGKLSMALFAYRMKHGTLPPAYLADEEGKPMHSWRVLLLPNLGEQALYDKYDFDEAWDGPNNIKLLNRMPDVYACPSAHHHKPGDKFCTNYVAIMGENTMWPSASIRDKSEVTDGLENTLLLAEFDDTKIPWLKPADLEYNKAIKILSSQDPNIYRQTHSNGRMVLFVDGDAKFIPSWQPEAFWKSIIGINDGIDWEALEVPYDFERNKSSVLSTIIPYLLFLVLMLLPLIWI
ncbi:MAG: DUF1559 family PulG-like putative transporter [Pirellulales bacterium]|jgi:prepilin-type processing-associated H-X9-DG protein